MSKNITIAEGAQTKIFNNVSYLKTNLIGGGTQYWVPEDEAGKYANVGEVTITENGTYSARDEDLDGFSSVRVNVSGGGGGDEPVLVTKNITSNGTYNASSDGADGYSQVVVNVPFPQHARTIINGVSHAAVSQRISTSDFIADFDEKLFTTIAPIIENDLMRAEWERRIRLGGWLTDFANTYQWNVNDLLNNNNIVWVGGGGADSNRIMMWLFAIGILDETAEVSLTNITPSSFTGAFTKSNQFTAHSTSGIYYMSHSAQNGYLGMNPKEMLSDINNHIGGTGENARIINYEYTAGNYGHITELDSATHITPMTNLTGGTTT